MTISAIGPSAATTSVERVTSATTTNQAEEANETRGADSVSVSKRGSMLAQLKALATSEPAKFKEVTKAISDKLTQAAASATGDDKQRLAALADRFGKASQTGDMSAFAPQAAQGAGKGHHAHGHHHHGGGASKAAGSSAADSIVSSVLGSLGTTPAVETNATIATTA